MSYKDDLAVKIATYTGEQMVALAYEAMIENLEDAKNAIINKDIELPIWFNKENNAEEISESEKKEMEKLLSEFR